MLLMCGLRSADVGTDTGSYLEAFDNHDTTGKNTEVLFAITYSIIPNPHLWLFFTACLVYVPLFFIVRKETYNAAVAVLVYMVSSTKFFPESFNIIRQSIAASFILACFVDWAHDRKKRSLIFLAVALLVHNSSIIALPFLSLKNIRFHPLFVWAGIGLTFLLGVFQILNESIGTIIMGAGVLSGDSSIGETINSYAAYGTNGTTFNTNFILANTLPISLMCLLTVPPRHTADEKDIFYFNILFVTTLIANIVIAATQFGFRLVFSLYIIQILVMANAYRYKKSETGKILLNLLLVFMCLLYAHYLHGLYESDIATIIPYRFFWQ